MLKPLLLSGWFRVQPFLNYVVVAILIAPLVAASAHSTSAKPSKQVAKNTSNPEVDSVPKEVANVGESDLTNIFKADANNFKIADAESGSQNVAFVGELQSLQLDTLESLVAKDYPLTSSDLPANDPLAAVELAPNSELSSSQSDLVQRLKAAKLHALNGEDNSRFRGSASKSLTATQIAPIQGDSQPSIREVPIEQTQAEQEAQVDPIGSPHPIPWKWILATQEAMGSKGNSGVRYYRSVPISSPDGKYAVYSRVKLEVRPELYNSRVTSVLFIEDKQTKKLRVIASTSTVADPLLSKNISASDAENDGKIGVLVPVSWSENSDRFLARQFEGVFNTGDSTDQAVIWDRQKNNASTVAPAQESNEHEKIAVLLGWSKNQPDHVLFRSGEMGDEEWPLVKVATDGQTATTTDADQPITYGQKLKEVWPGPQVAYR